MNRTVGCFQFGQFDGIIASAPEVVNMPVTVGFQSESGTMLVGWTDMSSTGPSRDLGQALSDWVERPSDRWRGPAVDGLWLLG
jgi:hypothetical protein